MVLNAGKKVACEYDKRIAGFTHEAGSERSSWSTMGYLTKTNHTMKNWYIREQFRYLPYAPIVFVSVDQATFHKPPEMTGLN